MDKIIVSILCIILGFLIAKLFQPIEIDKLKHQLIEDEDTISRLSEENHKLRKTNKIMSDTLKNVADSKEELSNIPDFDSW